MAEENKDKKPSKLVDYLEVIAQYERDYKKWEGRVEKILKRYRDERNSAKTEGAKFNILWSNVQTLVPATFSRLPRPDVTRRFKDNDPVGRVAALILERALDFEVQHYVDYRTTMRQSVYDRFLGGRGTSWARYEAKFKPADVQVTEDVQEGEVNEQLDYECAPTDYVHWKDFGHSVARTWEEVGQVWRRVYMNESAVKERFGKDIAKKLPYDATPETDKKMRDTTVKKQALIYELWDKDLKSTVWISKSYKDFLDEKEDPLGLADFFPCPRPLYASLTNESLQPIPDFTLYQDQAKQLDLLADRIQGLGDMLQVKGIYDDSVPALARLFTEGGNGTLLPAKNWAAFSEKGGLKGTIDVLDLKMVADAMAVAQETMEQVKNQVYEITGISDIIRGQTDAAETATAQQMKGQFASLRLKSLQEDVSRYATEILQLKAQIICQKFNPKTIATMAAVDQLTPEDQQVMPQALALLVGEERLQDPDAEGVNPLRSFRIEVAADTLVQLDEQREKQDRMEMLTAFGGYLKQAAEIGAVAPAMIPLVIEVGKFGIQAFKVGKSIEGTFDTALDQLKQMVQQQMQNPQPDPKVEAEKAKAEVAKEKGAIDIQVAREKMQIEREKMAGQQQMQQSQMAIDQQQHQQDMAMQGQDMQMQQQAGAMKQEQMQAQHQQKMKQASMPPKRVK